MSQYKKHQKGGSAWGVCLSFLAFFSPLMVSPVIAQIVPVAGEDALLMQSRQAFELLPESERKAIQEALVWLGLYNMSGSGSFNRQTYAGLLAYQKKNGGAPERILEASFIEKLKSAGRAARAAVGFEIIRDDGTGIEIGIPTKVLPKRSVTPSGGGRWQSLDDLITLDTRNTPGGEDEFSALYEKLIKPSSDRKVTYKVRRSDFFVVTGETENGVFYQRYVLGPDDLRGFSVGYDKNLKTSFDPIVIAIANSFNPLPSNMKPEVLSQRNETAVSTSPAAEKTIVPAKTATGVRINQRNVVTVGFACDAPKINGRPAKLIKQAAPLALWDRGEEEASMAVLPVQLEAIAEGADVVVVSWDASSGGVGVTTGSVEKEQKLSTALQLGGRGGLVFDRYGAVIGLINEANTPVRTLGGASIRASYSFVPVQNVLAFLGPSNSLTGKADMNGALSAGAIAATALARVEEVVCP